MGKFTKKKPTFYWKHKYVNVLLTVHGVIKTFLLLFTTVNLFFINSALITP
jgi:hypothetical protein